MYQEKKADVDSLAWNVVWIYQYEDFKQRKINYYCQQQYWLHKEKQNSNLKKKQEKMKIRERTDTIQTTALRSVRILSSVLDIRWNLLSLRLQ